jgi:multiple sugar transport system ATP-binding protein
MADMSSVEIQRVSKRFGDFTAVDDLTLSIANGEFVALLGPSGCGKTTTMNMIAGIESASTGDIFFDGRPPTSTRVQDRNIGFVFQNYAIFTHLTVRDNLAYGLVVKRKPPAEVARKVAAMAERMSIAHRLDEKAATLSVNEMQKLAIGRSAICEPRLFLLDEPLSNLDAGFRAYMRAELKVLQHEFKQTMVYVTHDQVEAMSLADRIAIIDRGRLMQYGQPLDVYNNPENVFVARFIGSPAINLIEGKLEPGASPALMRLHEGGRLHLPARLAAGFARASTARGVLGVRAQDVYVGPLRSGDDIVLPASVEVVERVGPLRVAHVHTAAGPVRVMDGVDEVRPGDALTLHLREDRCFAFDAETGQRLDAKENGHGRHQA